MSERVSMETFGPVSVDYFHGRRVAEVLPGDGAEGSPLWIIKFDGGAEICNYEPECPTPTAIVGQALTKTIFNSTDRTTRLLFGLEEVVLNPLKYSIIDENYTKGYEVFAQASDFNALPSLPDDPSPERVADGPTPDGS